MSGPIWKHSLLRRRGGDDDGRVSFLELFFDVVFVFTVIQLSHRLAHHYDALGVLETGILILAVWWVWVYTTWTMNWLDPERAPVRAMLFLLMFLALVLSIAIPEAYESRGLLFALAFVAMQVGRSVFMASALKGYDDRNFRSFIRITTWLVFGGVFWIWGALCDHQTRLVLWLVAMVIDYLSPALGYWVPGLGRSASTDWNVSGTHIAERCALFIIICLGETILTTGGTLADTEVSVSLFAGLAVSFATTFGLWWVYFRFGQRRATHLIENADDPGAIARAMFTYPHFVIVAGIILAAVGFEFMLQHPGDIADVKTASAIIGGPALFVLGNIWFKGLGAHRPPLSHLGGLVLLAGVSIVHSWLSNLLLGLTIAAILIVVAAWEAVSLGKESLEQPAR
jgi:low temperature requirement protein LtrA